MAEGAPNDPTVMTTQQLERGLEAQKDYFDARLETIVQRLDGMDLATKVLNETVTRVPTDVQLEVRHLKELVTAWMEGLEQRFTDNDIRFDRQIVSGNKATSDALTAQKELVDLQSRAAAIAIDKSESAVDKSLDKLASAFKSNIDSVTGQISDLKGRLTTIEASKTGGNEVRSGFYALVGLGISVAFLAIAIISFVMTNRP